MLFGPERTGLSNDDLILADAVLSVPLNPTSPRSTSPRRCCWSATSGSRPASRRRRGRPAPPSRRATKGELDRLVEHLVGELDAADFFRTADRRLSMVRTLKVIVQRADLHEADVHLLRGVIKALAGGPRRRLPSG